LSVVYSPDAGATSTLTAFAVGRASTTTELSQYGATVTINPDGSFTYDPTQSAALQKFQAEGIDVVDTFEYGVMDPKGPKIDPDESIDIKAALPNYTYNIAAATSSGLYTSLGQGPSINDSGNVAFEGVNAANQSDLYIWPPTGYTSTGIPGAKAPQAVSLLDPSFVSGLPTTSGLPFEQYSSDVQINDSNYVLAQRELGAGGLIGEIGSGAETAAALTLTKFLLTYAEIYFGNNALAGLPTAAAFQVGVGDGGLSASGVQWGSPDFLDMIFTATILRLESTTIAGFAATTAEFPDLLLPRAYVVAPLWGALFPSPVDYLWTPLFWNASLVSPVAAEVGISAFALGLALVPGALALRKLDVDPLANIYPEASLSNGPPQPSPLPGYNAFDPGYIAYSAQGATLVPGQDILSKILFGGQNYLITGSGGAGTQSPLPTGATVENPKIGDNGDTVISTGTALQVYPLNLSTPDTVTGFSSVGANPAISVSTDDPDNGQDPWIAFAGVSNTLGVGIFITKASDPSAWYKIVGAPGDGVLNPNENWVDLNHDSKFEPGEASTPIQSFDVNGQLGISENAQGDLYVSFFAYVKGQDGKTHYSLQTVEIAPPGAVNEPDVKMSDVDPANENPHFLPRNDYWGATTVVSLGQILPGAGTVSAISTYAPINDSGQVVFWAQTNKGQVIVRADPINTQITVNQVQSSITNPSPPPEPVGVVTMTDNGVDPGVHNLFFDDDNGSFTLQFKDTATSGVPLHVKVYITGPANSFLDIPTAFMNSTVNPITVAPGSPSSVYTITEASLTQMLSNYQYDTLYGATFQIIGYGTDPAAPVLNEQFSVIRYLAVLDPNGVNNTPDNYAPFLKTSTVAPSAQTKTLTYYLPANMMLRFVNQNANGVGAVYFNVGQVKGQQYSTPLSGDNSITWTFNTSQVPPAPPGATQYITYSDNVGIEFYQPSSTPQTTRGAVLLNQANGQIATLVATETVAPPIELPVNKDTLQDAILAYLQNPQYFKAPFPGTTAPVLQASKGFLAALAKAGLIVNFATGTIQGTVAKKQAFAATIASGVLATVQSVFQNIIPDNSTAIQVVDNGDANAVQWTADASNPDAASLGGNPTLGAFDPTTFDPINGLKVNPIPGPDSNTPEPTLEDILFDQNGANPKYSLGAKAYAFAQAMQAGGEAFMGLQYLFNSTPQGPNNDPIPIVGQYLGTVLGHELGHYLALEDAYFNVQNPNLPPATLSDPQDPMGIMSSVTGPQSFAITDLTTILYTAGMETENNANTQGNAGLRAALDIYETNWYLPFRPVRTDGTDSGSYAGPGNPSPAPQPAPNPAPPGPNPAPQPAPQPQPAPVQTTMTSPEQLTVTYDVESNPYDYPITLRVYRSDQADYDRDNFNQVMIVNVQLTSADSTEGDHQIIITSNGQYQFLQSEPLRPDPTHEYVITTLDDNGHLNPQDVYNTPHFVFRIWVVAVVTHGLAPTGAIPGLSDLLNLLSSNGLLKDGPTDWVSNMATALQNDGYDLALPFNWEQLSVTPDAQATEEAAEQLVTMILDDVPAELNGDGFNGAKDVVDLQLIGFSRGSVVISQALQDINDSNTVDTNDDLPSPPSWLSGGFDTMTMLDPHPADNEFGLMSQGNQQLLDLFDASALAVEVVRYFQATAEDENVVVPSNVSLAEDFYQNTPAANLTGMESYVNLWGESPTQIDNEDPGLTIQEHKLGATIGHSEVVDYYMQQVVEQKGKPGPVGDNTMFPYELTELGLKPFSNNPNADPLEITSEPPAKVTAGTPFSLVVKAEYDDGQVNTKFNGPVTLSLVETTHSSVILNGVLTVTAVNGIADFTGLTMNQAASGLQIIATTPTIPSALSDQFNVVAAAPALPQSSRQKSAQISLLSESDNDSALGGDAYMVGFYVAADSGLVRVGRRAARADGR
jgi:hypothetical protein